MEKFKTLSIKEILDNKKYNLQFLPSELTQLSTQKNILYKEKKLKTSYLIDIIHSLILKYYFRKENKFHLSSVILKEKYGYLYNYYIDFLVDKKILILILNHQKGKNSRIYSINEKILRNSITRYQNYDKTLIKKYKIKINEIQKNNGDLIDDDVKSKLINDLFKVQIQFDRAVFYLDSIKESDIDINNRNRYSIECINSNHIFYHFDNYGRLHTNFTILKSFIRKNCLTINGEETCELDIKNSQPLFLSKLIEDSETKWVNDDELDLFKKLTHNGKYYDYIMNYIKISDRNLAKELTYKVLFGKNNHNSQADKIFRSLFPTIHQFIKLYKYEKRDYRILSHELQKAESNLIFNKIIKKIIKSYPEVSLITVHDSIIFPCRYKNIIADIFNSEIHNYFNSNVLKINI